MAGDNSLRTIDLLDALQTGIMQAWAPADGVFPVEWEEPRLPIGGQDSSIPAPNGYAVIIPIDVEISMSDGMASMSKTNQKNAFRIRGRFPFPSDPTNLIPRLKVEKANQLIAVIQPGPVFAGIGVLPIVTTVSYGEEDNLNNQLFQVSLDFECHTRADHH